MEVHNFYYIFFSFILPIIMIFLGISSDLYRLYLKMYHFSTSPVRYKTCDEVRNLLLISADGQVLCFIWTMLRQPIMLAFIAIRLLNLDMFSLTSPHYSCVHLILMSVCSYMYNESVFCHCISDGSSYFVARLIMF